ncbi:conserved hypothetical protein [Crenothrix polyspora]|uniref:Lipoprotein n=1 Tax=Crenothrix polyspora TaxID=360316 RepID=A0A1R4HDX0_9GAMM|nr:conserved hypothetical protein [Crenothrix polyspora]
MKKHTVLFWTVLIMLTVGCEGNTTGMNRHKPEHHTNAP